jgi:hypothetical protein
MERELRMAWLDRQRWTVSNSTVTSLRPQVKLVLECLT